MTLTEDMTLTELEYWFATNKTEFDKSALGFYNWIKKYRPEFIEDTQEEINL